MVGVALGIIAFIRRRVGSSLARGRLQLLAVALLHFVRVLAMTEADTVWSFQPAYADGKATIVKAQMVLFQVADVDTSKGTAFIKVLVWLRWKDPRLAGWTKRPLPCDLWTPRLVLLEARADMVIRTTEYKLEDAETGAMLTTTWYEGTIVNNMESLEAFPMDFETLTMSFYAAEMYTPDGTGNGNDI